MSTQKGKGNFFKITTVVLAVLLLASAFLVVVKFNSVKATPMALNVEASADKIKISPGETVTLTAFNINGSSPYRFCWTYKEWFSNNSCSDFIVFSNSNPAKFKLNETCLHINFAVTVTDANGYTGNNYEITVWDPTALSTMTLAGGIYPGAPSYTIWTEGGNYYAKNASGFISFESTDCNAVFEAVTHVGGGGDIDVSSGTYHFTVAYGSIGFTLSQATYLHGSGNDTILDLTSGSRGTLIAVTSSDVEIANLHFRGHHWSSTGTNGWVIGDGTTSVSSFITGGSCDNLRIHDNYFENYGFAVNMVAVTNSFFQNNRVKDMWVGFMWNGHGDKNIVVTGNIITNTYDDCINFNGYDGGSSHLESNSSGHLVANNIFIQNGFQGACVKLDANGGQLWDVTVENNKMVNGTNCVRVDNWYTSDMVTAPTGVKILGNTIETWHYTGAGIYVLHPGNNIVNSNIDIEGNTINVHGATGIAVYYMGNVTLRNNEVNETGASAFCYRVLNCSSVIMSDNRAYGTGYGGQQYSLVNNTYSAFYQNKGYNPKGAITYYVNGNGIYDSITTTAGTQDVGDTNIESTLQGTSNGASEVFSMKVTLTHRGNITGIYVYGGNAGSGNWKVAVYSWNLTGDCPQDCIGNTTDVAWDGVTGWHYFPLDVKGLTVGQTIGLSVWIQNHNAPWLYRASGTPYVKANVDVAYGDWQNYTSSSGWYAAGGGNNRISMYAEMSYQLTLENSTLYTNYDSPKMFCFSGAQDLTVQVDGATVLSGVTSATVTLQPFETIKYWDVRTDNGAPTIACIGQ
jgi:hypothetical protein